MPGTSLGRSLPDSASNGLRTSLRFRTWVWMMVTSTSPTPYSYFAWLPLPDPWSANSFVTEARARGIVITPAEYFVLDECQPANAVRICLGANTSRDSIRHALATLSDILDNHRHPSPPPQYSRNYIAPSEPLAFCRLNSASKGSQILVTNSHPSVVIRDIIIVIITIRHLESLSLLFI